MALRHMVLIYDYLRESMQSNLQVHTIIYIYVCIYMYLKLYTYYIIFYICLCLPLQGSC